MRSLVIALVLAAPAGAQLQLDKLVASDAFNGSGLGAAVALDDARALVGAPFEPNGGSGSGAAYLFERVGASFVEVQKLVPANPQGGARFGCALALFEATALVGALEHAGRGAVFVFQRPGALFVEVELLSAADGAAGDELGAAVALGPSLAVVGAPGDDPGGSAYVFERIGGQLVEVAKLEANGTWAQQRFGASVALAGSRVLVGAPGSLSSTGAAYVFERQGGGAFVQTAKLVASGLSSGDAFGSAVALSGELALVGAPLTGPLNDGAAYVFEHTLGGWVERQRLAPKDLAFGDAFGQALALVGARALLAAPADDDNGVNSGSLYVFEQSPSGFVETAKLVPKDGASSDDFGTAVALSGDTLLCGAPEDDDAGTNSGSAYAFSLAPAAILAATPGALSVAAGGTQALSLRAGSSSAGRIHLLLGSASPTFGGVPVDAVVLPLSVDLYTLFTLTNANTPPLTGGLGLLDAKGEAAALFTLPPAANPAVVGLTLRHAFLVFKTTGLPTAVLASNAVTLELGA